MTMTVNFAASNREQKVTGRENVEGQWKISWSEAREAKSQIQEELEKPHDEVT